VILGQNWDWLVHAAQTLIVLEARPDTGEPGLPYHVLLRAVLGCATVTEALKVLQAGLRSSSGHPVSGPGGPAPRASAAATAARRR
jgi:isopenicillin-N N-acyltransferase like protein